MHACVGSKYADFRLQNMKLAAYIINIRLGILTPHAGDRKYGTHKNLALIKTTTYQHNRTARTEIELLLLPPRIMRVFVIVLHLHGQNCRHWDDATTKELI